MSAGVWNFVIEQGSTFARTLTWTSGGSRVNLSGYSIQMGAKYDEDDSEYVFTASNGGGEFTVTNVASGVASFTLTGTTTSSYVFDRVVYNIKFISAGGVTTRLLKGEIGLSKDV